MAVPTVEYWSPLNSLPRDPGAPERSDIFIWDDFWPSPDELRADALMRSFTFCHSPGGFAFNSAETDETQVRRVLDLLIPALGSELADAKSESRFVVETASDEQLTRQKIWVHYDEWIRIGLLYLSPPNSPGGTDFFRHRSTGHTSIRTVAPDQRDRVLADSTRPEAWEVIEHVEIRFNRLVLFRPHFFHQASCYFGSSLENGRLNFVVTFPPGEESAIAG